MFHSFVGLAAVSALTLLAAACGSAETSEPPTGTAPQHANVPSPSTAPSTPSNAIGTSELARSDAPALDESSRPHPTGVVHVVEISDTGFTPVETSIALGDSVDFVWKDGVHSVTSGFDCRADGMFDSATRPAPATYRVTFLMAGPFPFFSRNECDRVTGALVVKKQ